MGGLLYISTYNYNSVGSFIWRQNWREFYPPYHCNYFSKRVLIHGLRLIKNGFTIHSLKANGLCYYSNKNNWLMNRFIKILSIMATFLNIGDHLEIVTYKNKQI